MRIVDRTLADVTYCIPTSHRKKVVMALDTKVQSLHCYGIVLTSLAAAISTDANEVFHP